MQNSPHKDVCHGKFGAMVMLKSHLFSYLSECRNLHDDEDQCQDWARRGECQRNPGWMAGNCRVACHSCPTEGQNYRYMYMYLDVNRSSWQSIIKKQTDRLRKTMVTDPHSVGSVHRNVQLFQTTSMFPSKQYMYIYHAYNVIVPVVKKIGSVLPNSQWYVLLLLYNKTCMT